LLPRLQDGTVIDTTERNQTQATLRASEERFRLIAENIPELVATHTSEGELEFGGSNAVILSQFAAIPESTTTALIVLGRDSSSGR
jgi:PAS domain-containing protein